MDPFFRSHRTPIFKTDHPTLGYMNQGHLMNPKRKEFLDQQRARVYTAWEPPQSNAPREGKKIVDPNRPKNEGKLDSLDFD